MMPQSELRPDTRNAPNLLITLTDITPMGLLLVFINSAKLIAVVFKRLLDFLILSKTLFNTIVIN